MILGYEFYLPLFGSHVNSNYITSMYVQFSALATASAIIAFFLGRVFLLKLKVSIFCFLSAGLFFNFISPEGNQQHWTNGFIDLTFIYILTGLLVISLLYFASRPRKSVE